MTRKIAALSLGLFAACAVEARAVETNTDTVNPTAPAAVAETQQAPAQQGQQEEPADLFDDVSFDSTWNSNSEPAQAAEAAVTEDGIEIMDDTEVAPGEIIAIEGAIERWVRDLITPFIEAKDYSVYVDVSLNPDPYKLAAYRKRSEDRALPGLMPSADESDNPRENPLFSMIEKKKIILVFFRPITDAQRSLITEILKAKRLIVDTRGDALTINSAAAEPTITGRLLETFSFQAEEGQPAWLGPLSAFVSVAMVFAFVVLIWQIFMLKKAGPVQRQIRVAPARRRPAASEGPSAGARAFSVAGSVARVLGRASAPAARAGSRASQVLFRAFRRKVLKQVVPPVWPPKALLSAPVRAAVAAAPAAAPFTIQVLPVGGYFSFRNLSALPREALADTLRSVDSRTIAMALMTEDTETLEMVLSAIPDPRKEELLGHAIELGKGETDLRPQVAAAKSRITEILAAKVHLDQAVRASTVS